MGEIKKVYIKGSNTLFNEVISTLESYGGINVNGLIGEKIGSIYTISQKDRHIVEISSRNNSDLINIFDSMGYTEIKPIVKPSYVEYVKAIKKDLSKNNGCEDCVISELCRKSPYKSFPNYNNDTNLNFITDFFTQFCDVYDISTMKLEKD